MIVAAEFLCVQRSGNEATEEERPIPVTVVETAFLLAKIGIQRPFQKYLKNGELVIQSKLHPSTCVGIIRAILFKYRISVIDIWLNGLVCSEDWSLVCVQKDIPTAVAHSLGCIVPPVSILLDAVTKWKQGTVTITLWWFEVEHSSIIFHWKELANVADQEYESRYKIGSSAFHLQQIFFSQKSSTY